MLRNGDPVHINYREQFKATGAGGSVTALVSRASRKSQSKVLLSQLSFFIYLNLSLLSVLYWCCRQADSISVLGQTV